MSARPIAEHGLVSDCHTAALVDIQGSVEWWCVPDFDSPSVFSRLLDDGGGHFSLSPVSRSEVTRSYRTGSLVLVTTFTTDTGVVELTDTLAMAEGVREHELGVGSPRVMLRELACLEGHADLEAEFAPRLENGLTIPLFRRLDGGVLASGGAHALRLSASVPMEVEERMARADFEMTAGDTVAFAVAWSPSWEKPPPPWDRVEIQERIEDTGAAWRSWEAVHQRYQGPYSEMVNVSGRVLQGLTFRPTGAVVAAPTTSLPEAMDGDRNWDYRYAWVRDASLTLDALWVAACPDEAADFVGFLRTAASSFLEREELQIMFGVRGERDLTERELPWLSGWRGVGPVRVGNDAWHQSQLDVYGELLGAVHRLEEELPDLESTDTTLLAGLADIAAKSWREADHGIWEIRGDPRQYLHSKLMCWVALDCAIDFASWLDAEDRVERWKSSRADIRQAILDRGWSEAAGSFTQTLDGEALDAAALLIPISEFLPPDDPRVLSTIDAIQERLTDSRGLVHRYRSADGLAGEEGPFLLCSFWLAQALAMADRPAEARGVFENAAGQANDLGLLSEQTDASSGELLGNFPQSFSHVGLINAAWSIQQAESRAQRDVTVAGVGSGSRSLRT